MNKRFSLLYTFLFSFLQFISSKMFFSAEGRAVKCSFTSLKIFKSRSIFSPSGGGNRTLSAVSKLGLNCPSNCGKEDFLKSKFSYFINSSFIIHHSSFFCLALFLLINSPLFAQFPSDYNDRSNNTGTPQTTQLNPAFDTLSKDVYYFHLENPTNKLLLKDTSIQNFHIFNPIRQQAYDYISTGNFGGAHRTIVYQPRFHQGFDAGFHNYDVYQFKKEEIRYYSLEKAYSDIAFSQGASQQETDFKGKFSKNLSPLINLGLNYHRINNQGIYFNQQSKNTSLTGNSWYQSPNNRYQGFLSYNTNTIQQKENGGINFLDTLGNLTKSVVAVGRPINTQQAESRYFQRELTYSQYYELGTGQKDTTAYQPTNNRQYTLFHQLNLKRNTYKFFDDLTNTTANYYGDFEKGDRGVRQFMDIKQYENTFSIRTFKQQKSTSTAWQKSKEVSTKDLIEVGITHSFTKIAQEPIDSSFHNAFLFGKIQFTPSDRLKIKTYAHLGILGQIGDYYLKGDFLVAVPKLGQIELELIAQHYAPSLLQQRLYVTQQLIWNNNFSNTFENSFAASYYLPQLNLSIKGQYQLLSNYIYYNELAQAQQATSDVNILQLILGNHLKWKGFLLENTVYLQNVDQDFLRLPKFYSIHRLSFNTKLFKQVMDFQVGAQVRINSPYFVDNFQPLTAQFFLQNQAKSTYYPTIDGFLNFKIKDFRFFLNVQNIYDYFTLNFDYPIYGNPAFDSSIRFGFRWQFLD